MAMIEDRLHVTLMILSDELTSTESPRIVDEELGHTLPQYDSLTSSISLAFLQQRMDPTELCRPILSLLTNLCLAIMLEDTG